MFNVTEKPIKLRITGDNRLRLYVDGQLQASKGSKWRKWRQPSKHILSGCSKVLAVSCENTDKVGGILGSTNRGIVTDSSWRCTNTLEINYAGTTFVETPGVWEDASSFGVNDGDSPWRSVDRVKSFAHWIWTSDNTKFETVYCRLVL